MTKSLKPRRAADREGTQDSQHDVHPPCVGRLVSGSRATCLLVDFDGNAHGPLPARSTIVLDDVAIQQVITSRRGVLITFDRGNPRLPIITGLLTPTEGEILLADLLADKPSPSDAARATPSPDVEARVDGETILLEGRREIVLKCGRASITLCRDGKILIKGAYIETDADGVNRIKGGAVKIN